ncbi:MAG: hypothetical protein JSU96_06260 [Acidobacteriota bacterium]|nr:MAG: hypothetical protein JSU96_06260 [Acidobacteriota bacterium]
MKVLHIFRSSPAHETLRLVDAVSKGNSCLKIHLFDAGIEYDELIKMVFAADRVISWW